MHRHLGEDEGAVAYQRLILTHPKSLVKGAYLIDDNPHSRGTAGFEAESIHCGGALRDWDAVLEYLRPRARLGRLGRGPGQRVR